MTTTPISTRLTLPVLLVLASLLGACGARYAIDTPDGMVTLEEPSWSRYDERATTPHGVVLAVRTIRQGERREVPYGDLAFWAEATRLRMRTTAGYALLDESEVSSADGTPGVHMSFGRDQQGQPYRYDVVLFVTPRVIHVVEIGGEAERYDEIEDELTRALASYEVHR